MRSALPTRWFFLAFLALIYTACDNEPLEGEFPQEEENPAGEGQFIAVINNNGFEADVAVAVFDQNNTLTITGTNNSTGEVISLVVENGTEGTFDLSTSLGSENIGLYIDGNEITNPYITATELGGFGQLQITEIDDENQTITGTFSLTGLRAAVDDSGNPILDGDGNPVLETISISNGAFNQIEFTNDNSGGGGGGPQNLFFAKVDGIDFVAEEVTTERNLINEIPVIRVSATNAEGQLIRIDIPEELGTGTFDMESISNGTQLIGIYNPNVNSGEDLTSNPGTITITSFNTLAGRMVATFEFTATDPLGADPTVAEITEGSFEINYTPAESNPENTMQVDVDGVTWIATNVDAFSFDLSGTETVTVRGYNNASGEFIQIIFPMDLEPGSYEFVSTTVPGEPIAQFYPVLGGVEFTSTDGSLVVLSNDLMTGGSIEAGFLFFAEDLSGDSSNTYSLTNGVFNISLP